MDSRVLAGVASVDFLENGVDGGRLLLRAGLLDGDGVGEGEGGVGPGDDLEPGVLDGVFDGAEVGNAGEDVNLAGDAVGIAGGGDDGFDFDEVLVDEGGEGGGDGAFDVADGEAVGVEDYDGVRVVRVVGLAGQAHQRTLAVEGAGVVLQAHDVGHDEAQQVFV